MIPGIGDVDIGIDPIEHRPETLMRLLQAGVDLPQHGFAPAQRLLGLLAVGDIDGIPGEQGSSALDNGELERRVVPAVQVFVEPEHPAANHHIPVVGGDLGGELRREQFRHGLADHVPACRTDHLGVVLTRLDHPAVGRRHLLDKGVDRRMAHEEGKQLVALAQGLLGFLRAGSTATEQSLDS